MKRIDIFRNNVEYIVWGYANLMNDTGAPALSMEEIVNMVIPEVYNFISDGNGSAYFNDMAASQAKALKFIPAVEKKSIIEDCALEAGIVKE